MSDNLQVSTLAGPAAVLPLPAPWRDPHTVPRELLTRHIAALERDCSANPESAALWTCLGMAYAMDYRAHQSMQALEEACSLAPNFFWARYKYAELLFRLRALSRAEQETARALELAATGPEYALCRRQLQEVRRLIREGTQKPAWTKPLLPAALASFAVIVLLCLADWALKYLN